MTIKCGSQRYVAAVYVCNGKSGVYQMARSLDGGRHFADVGFPTTANVVRLRFATPDIGFAALGASGLYRTTDGALSWTLVINATVHDVGMADTRTGFACGVLSGSSTIWKTVDGGFTWSATTIAGIGGTALRGIAVASPLIAYCVGSAYGGVGRIYRTADGGDSWTNQSTGAANYAGVACGPLIGEVNIGTHAICCTDSSGGYAYWTTDSGGTWTATTLLSSDGLVWLEKPIGIEGYAACMGKVGRLFALDMGYRSDDWGQTARLYKSGSLGTFVAIAKLSDSTAFCLTDNGHLITTTDGGWTWSALGAPYAYPGAIAAVSGFLTTGPASAFEVR